LSGFDTATDDTIDSIRKVIIIFLIDILLYNHAPVLKPYGTHIERL